MKFTFLGTSAGKPTKERGLTAIGVEFDQDNKWYLFDCGEGTQFQLMHVPLSIGKLEAIFITHLHGDHFYGLPGLLSSKKMDDALSPLTLYGPKGIRAFIESVLDVSHKDFGYELTIIEYEAGEVFVFDKFHLTVVPVVHSIESVAFVIEENDIANKLDEAKLRAIGLEPSPIYGEIKRGKTVIHEGREIDPKAYMLDPIKGRRIIISGDNAAPEVLGGYLDDLDLLIHESTYTQAVYDAMPKKFLHTTAKDLGVSCETHRVKNLIATHISPRYAIKSKYPLQLVHDEISAHYHGRHFIASDLDVYLLSRDRVCQKEDR